MQKFFLYIIIIYCLYPNFATAHKCDKFYSNKLNCCHITKRAFDDYEPEIFHSSNNLLRKTGQFPCISGQKIIIKGRVLDQKCLPVQDAKIYLWQVGSDGKYPYVPLRFQINEGRINLRRHSTFTGSGIATSNNKGEYYFITVFPGRAPHTVNIRVEHRDLGKLQTKLFLTDKYADIDNCGEINPALASIPEYIKTYTYDIIIPGRTLKRY